MFRNVIVGVDQHSEGRDAIALAVRLAAPGATLTLAHIYTGFYAVSPEVLAWVDEERKESETFLHDLLARTGVTAEGISLGAESVGEGLHRLAQRHHADLLVIGTTRHGVAGRVLIGDDARSALNGAPCAVACAPLGYAGDEADPTATIGVGYDGTPESDHALAVARELATAAGATVEALHVVHVPSVLAAAPLAWENIEPTMVATARAKLDLLPGVTGSAVAGDPMRVLSAMSHRVGLLVVGSRGYGPFRRAIYGSTSAYLQRHAACPLLVIPRGAEETPS
jgi:nucleotide-binding universal stress UspA family protein